MDALPVPVSTSSPAGHRDDEVGAAVFRILADGQRHAFADFAGATREAVLADLAALRSRGMAMRLDDASVQAAAFTPLDATTIARDLDRDTRARQRAPWRVNVAFELGSTNTELLRDVKRHDRDDAPRVLAAEFQTAGRGRLGRDWSSAPGASITVSFAFCIARGIARLDGVTLVCGLAVQRVVASFGLPVRLKWPNDLLVDGRKLAGILVEAHATSSGTVLVIGVGINVALAAPHLADAVALPAANLWQEGATPVDRNRLIAELALALEAHLAVFESEGFDAFVDAWNAADAFADRPVRLASPPGPPVIGIARGVDAGGALLLDVGGDRRRIIAGDVSLRPADNATGST